MALTLRVRERGVSEIIKRLNSKTKTKKKFPLSNSNCQPFEDLSLIKIVLIVPIFYQQTPAIKNLKLKSPEVQTMHNFLLLRKIIENINL